jgi:putative component of toxin-antitoxin plasmid stabilization module
MMAISALYLREDCEPEISAMARVIAEFVHIVGENRGSMKRLDSGVMELRLETGEVFHLSKETVTRVA